MNSLLIILKPLLLTIVIETIIAYFLNIKTKKELINIILINVITNTLLTLFIYCYVYLITLNTSYETYGNSILLIVLLIFIIIPILELIIVFVEYKLFKKFLIGDRNYLLISFILNIGSFLGGIVWQIIISNYL